MANQVERFLTDVTGPPFEPFKDHLWLELLSRYLTPGMDDIVDILKLFTVQVLFDPHVWSYLLGVVLYPSPQSFSHFCNSDILNPVSTTTSPPSPPSGVMNKSLLTVDQGISCQFPNSILHSHSY